jgi:ribonuclease P protein component
MSQHVTKNLSSFTQQDIAHLLKNAQIKARVPGLRVLLGSTTLPYGRILVITPRHSGNAVKRNLIRRRLKAIFYQEQWFQYGYDCVVIVKKDGIGRSFEDLKTLLIQAFSTSDNQKASSSTPKQS